MVGDLGVQLRQVQRLGAQPFDHVALGELVLVVLVSATGTTTWRLAGSCGQHLGLQPPHEADPPQMPVQSLLGPHPAEAVGEPRAGAEVRQAVDHPQLRDQLVGVVEHRRAGQRQPQPVGRHRRGQRADRLGALGARVLAVMRLVDHDRARAATRQRLAVSGDDLVVQDR